MDNIITFSIVAIAALWAVARLRRHFVAKRALGCAGCSSGCGPAVAQRSRVSRCGAAKVTGLIIAAVALVSPLSLFAQEPSEDELSRITAEIGKLKTALQSLPGGISVEGFVDMKATTPRAGQAIVTIGDFEVDLAKDLGKNVQIAAALVANDEGASLAVAFVDFHLSGGLIAPRGRLPVEKGIHLQIGRFDVPFGNDWRYLASKDRTESSAPLTTDVLMDGGYTDTGVRVRGGSRTVNYTAFVMRGQSPGKVLGGRLGFTPFDDPYQFQPRSQVVEVGLSVLRDVDRAGSARATFIALDSETQIGRCRIRTEHVQKRVRSTKTEKLSVESSGWHVTAAFDAGQIRGMSLMPYARYDATSGDGIDGPKTERLTAGLSTSIFSIVVLKVEYQRTMTLPDEHSLSAQLVMVF